jgi:hypothetical protein
VNAVAEVAEPRLEAAAVRLLDQLAILDEASLTRDGRPLAGAVDEGDVDVRVVGQVVGLAGLVVCVEEKVDASGFLFM